MNATTPSPIGTLPPESPGSRVAKGVRSWITEGTLQPGHPLPSERAIAEKFGVARVTVRQTIKSLEREGLILSNGNRRRVVAHSQPKPNPLCNILMFLSLNPKGTSDNHTMHGWADWIDQGVINEMNRQRAHYMTFHATEENSGEFSTLLNSEPRAIVVSYLWDLPFIRQCPALAEAVAQWRDKGRPVVVYGDEEDAQTFDRVSSDFELGSYLLTRHLLERGFKRPLMFKETSSIEHRWFQQRRVGYERAMIEAKQEPLPVFECEEAATSGDTTFEAKVRYYAGSLLAFFHNGGTADILMAASDGLVPSLAAAARLLGKQLHLTGYDNYWDEIPERSLEETAPIATIDKRYDEIGAELVKMAFQRSMGKLPPEPQINLVAPQLIVRQEK